MNNKHECSVTLPCRIGDTVYSIIGEKVHPYVITEFRIEQDEKYAIAGDMYFKESNLGVYWFLNENIAEEAFKIWRNKRNETKK